MYWYVFRIVAGKFEFMTMSKSVGFNIGLILMKLNAKLCYCYITLHYYGQLSCIAVIIGTNSVIGAVLKISYCFTSTGIMLQCNVI